MPAKPQWRAHLPRLIEEIANNPQCSALVIPLRITREIIDRVAQRAIELNDPQLNALMCRLTLYEQSDPYSPHYNKEVTDKTILEGNRIYDATH